MARKIESYNASYPAAFYEIGTLYAFYAKGSAKGSPASEKQIQRFSSVLNGLEERRTASAVQSVKVSENDPPLRKGSLTRYYAVVVGKNLTNIEIMFLNKDGDKESFLTRRYTVNGSATTDGKELMVPSTHTSVIGMNENNCKIGGITKAVTIGKTGGITKAGNNTSVEFGIGRITKADKSVNAPKTSDQKVGGIIGIGENIIESTPQIKVGGITRMKK